MKDSEVIAALQRIIDTALVWPESRRFRLSRRPLRSDADAMRGDWERVGEDMSKAIEKAREGR